MDINNPHDSFFRRIFSNKKNVKDLLKNSIPENIISQIELDDITISFDTYVDEDLKSSESDMVVKTKLKQQDLIIYFLYEHKSYKYKYSLFQLLKYMIKIWETEKHNKRDYFTPIVPILYKHGEHKWTLGDSFSIYFPKDIPAFLCDYVPDFRSIIFDLSAINDEDIKGNIWYKSAVQTMKHINEIREYLKSLLDYIFSYYDYLNPLPSEFIELMRYIFIYFSSSDMRFIEGLFKQYQMEGLYMSLLDEILREGREEGREEGIKEGEERGKQEGIQEGRKETAKKMKTKGMDIQIIEEITGLNKEEIEKL